MVQAPKAGLYKIRARPDTRELLEGTGYVLVRAQNGRKKGALSTASPFRLVAYQSPQPPPASEPPGSCSATESRSKATGILTVKEGGETGGAFRASLESATIQAFFQADDGGSAPANVLVWLSPDHGELDH